MTATVRDNQTGSRFEVVADDTVAGHAEYTLAGDVMTLTHTEVDDAFAGRGLAKQLAEGALSQARERGLHVIPQCRFIASYLKKNEQWVDLVPADRRAEHGL